MKRCFTLSTVLAAALFAPLCIGCGGSETAQTTPDANTASSGTGSQAVAQSAPQADIAGASQAVSQFLDRVRRGGENSAAEELLTAKAQSEFARIGRSVQPIGTPDAKFTVTRSQAIPGEENSVLVHSLWTEPNEVEGGTSEFQVVWAVQYEQSQWRISGLAMELEKGADPLVVDFEDGDMMDQLLAPEQSNAIAENPQAPTAGQNR